MSHGNILHNLRSLISVALAAALMVGAAPHDATAVAGANTAAPAPRMTDSNRPALAGSTVPVNYVKAPNAEAYDRFGDSIAISGDTLVVGAKGESGDITSTAGSPNNFADDAGAVYVYVRSGSDWVLQQYLKSPRVQEGAEFGGSVAIDGDTIAVGEIGNGDCFLYMFTRTSGVWTHQSTVTPTIPSFGNDFGESISIDGDTMVVGDPNEDGSSTSTVASPNELAENAGAAYVFTRSVDGTWTQQVYLKASNVGEDDEFGARVKVDGDTIVVSAPGEDGSITSTMASPNELTEDAGAVYVFTRSVDGTWTQQAYLKASETENWSYFGKSVALENDTLIVGQESDNPVAYAFVRSDGVWTQQAELRMERSVGYGFGASVALNGNFALISAGNDNFLGKGSLQMFLRSGTTWTHHAHLAVANMTAYDALGYGPDNIAFDGTTIFAGADGEDGSVTSTLASPNELADSAGAVYMFQGPGSTNLNLSEGTMTPAFVTTTQSYTAAVPDTSTSIVVTTSIGWLSELTVTTATPCDTSRGPVAASAPQFLTTCPLATDPNAITFTNLITFTVNDGDGIEQNYTVAITRTSNDASLSALALSAGDLTPAFVSTTTSYTTDVPNAVAAVTMLPTANHIRASFSVTNADGDCEALGCPLVVGANTLTLTVTAQDGVTTQDYVVVVARAAPTATTAVVPAAYLKASNADESDRFGLAVAVSGDTIVVGAPNENGSLTSTVASPNKLIDSAGAAYVYVRSGAGWQQTQVLKSTQANTYNTFGWSVAVDGDTMVVGEPSALGYYGAAHVFTRTDGVWSHQAMLTSTNPGFLDKFGGSVAIDGDTIIVGAYQEDGSGASTVASPDNAEDGAGAAYVFVRSGGAWTQQAYLKASNAGNTDYFGISVDVSGDSAVIGAMYEAGSVTSTIASPNEFAPYAGAAYVFTRTAGVWTQQQYLKASDASGSGLFGVAVAIDGDTLVVGGSNSSFLFMHDDISWTEQDKNSISGYSVALDGDLAVIGDKTAARVFTHNGGKLTAQAYLTATNDDFRDQSGTSIAVAGDIVVTGAPMEDGSVTSTLASLNEFADSAGAVYVFRGPGSTQISPTNTALTPAFISTTQSYTAEVANGISSAGFDTSIAWRSVLTVTAASPCNSYRNTSTSTSRVTSSCPLEVGPNVITFTVNDGAGAEQNYFVTITRGASATPTPTPTNTPESTPTTPPTSTPGGPTSTPAPTNTPAATPTSAPPTPTPAPQGIFVTPKRGAIFSATVSIMGLPGTEFLDGPNSVTGVYVNGIKMYHVVRSKRRVDFAMKPGVPGSTVDVVLVKTDGTVMTFTQAYTFEGPTTASGSTAAGVVLTTTSGITISVPPQTAARSETAQSAGALLITYYLIDTPSDPPGDVPHSFFAVSIDMDGSSVFTITNPATFDLPVDTARVPFGHTVRLYEWTTATIESQSGKSESAPSALTLHSDSPLSVSPWQPVASQSYDPAAGRVTAQIERLGAYVLVTEPASRWWFPMFPLQ